MVALIGILLLVTALSASAAAAGKAGLEIDAKTARPTELSFDGRKILLTGSQAGFIVHDFNARRDVALEGRHENFRFTAQGDDLSLRATFTPDEGAIRVEGEIESARSQDRAIILRYGLPLQTQGAVFEDELSRSTRVEADTRVVGTVFPVAAMTGQGWGVAMAIPPTFPCCFGMTGSKDGLGVEFYLGLSPATPRAAFRFLIYAAEPGWGFRSALARYHERHREFYDPRFKGGGFWNWQEKGDIERALPLYRIQGITRTQTFLDEIKRNQRFGILTFDYTIVGQRELTRLPELPPDYDGAMKVVDAFAKEWREKPEGELRRRYGHWRDHDLPDLIERCGCKGADGRFRMMVRSSAWGKDSITFTMNPNPILFADKGLDTVGSTTLRTVQQWFERDPIDGIMVDSLGAQWPATLNHRRDHFAYARYPLTFDKEGRVALHNRVSHYEFVEALWRLARDKGKFLFANGVYRYRRASMPEHFNGVENGRFFLAALLDAAGREQTALLDRATLEFARAAMGRKLYAALLYKWQDPNVVRRQMNRALPFAVFAGPNRCFTDDISYLKSPDGYERDRELLEWFIKHCRALHDAGWQPVTHARVGQPSEVRGQKSGVSPVTRARLDVPGVVCERYGAGNVIYFALVNLDSEPRPCEVAMDLAALGMSPREGEMCHVAEIARGARFTEVTEDETCRVRLTLEPDQAHILKLSRAW